MPHIRHQLLIEASQEIVYNAITTREGLSAWWTPQAQAKAELNSIARFPFGPDYFKEMKIAEIRPFNEVQWNCISGAEEWIGTTISFKITSGTAKALAGTHPEITGQIQQLRNGDHASLLIFQHDGWKDHTPMFAECNYTWGQFLRSLKLLCETGKGRPWPDQHRITGG